MECNAGNIFWRKTNTPGHEINKNIKNKHRKKLIKSNISIIRFYFEDDKNRKVDFNRETITFFTSNKNLIYNNEFKYMPT